ncbi:MAG: hypothetical protein BA861_02585 [Desulfobacterales bacterium S3730MH5]|nr:MAG: hypothetical protein BA861_02585 [Desulfobacterales bacterium S3730MH5]OEU82386.1 MAG: hypothetical protein BA865_02995 [Desulfobacterales bacterium S5133MH4]
MEEEGSFPGQFRKLEEKVGELVQKCHDLQQTRSELEAKVDELEGTLRIKVGAEQEYEEERSVIGSRIDDLLGRLDQVLGSN